MTSATGSPAAATPVVDGPVGLISNPGSGHNRDQFEALRNRIDASPAIHHLITGSAAEAHGEVRRLGDYYEIEEFLLPMFDMPDPLGYLERLGPGRRP